VERTADLGDPAWLGFEQQCLIRARQGGTHAFGELYAAFAAALYRQVLLPRLREPALAEEPLAETFCSALINLDRDEGRGTSIWYWLARVAANKATDLQRRQASAGRALVRLAGLLDPAEGEQRQPEGALAFAERQQWLRQQVAEVLGRLNPRYRQAIELRILQERSRQEAAR